MSPSERLALAVEDALARAPLTSPVEVALAFDAIVSATAEAAILALVEMGWTEAAAVRVLGLRRVERGAVAV